MGRADVSDVVYLIKIDPQEYIDVPIISLIVKVGPLCILASIQLLGGTPMLARSKLGCTFPPCNCSKVAILRPLPRPLDRKMISILDSDKIHMLHYFLLIFFFLCVCVCVSIVRRRFIARLEKDEMEALLRRVVVKGLASPSCTLPRSRTLYIWEVVG